MQRFRRNSRRALVVAAAATLLGSCSEGYDVRAVAVGGKFAFISTDPNYDCLANINVRTDEETRAAPAAGDDRLLVANGGAFWWTDNPTNECIMDYPLFYGAGGPQGRTLVAAKKLKVGVTYRVETEGDGAYGVGCFRISDQHRIENLPIGRCSDIARASKESWNEGN